MGKSPLNRLEKLVHRFGVKEPCPNLLSSVCVKNDKNSFFSQTG